MVRLSLLLAPCVLAAAAPTEDVGGLSLLQMGAHKGHKKEKLALNQLGASSTERRPGIIQSIQKISTLFGDSSTQAPQKAAAPEDPLQDAEFQKLIAEMKQGKHYVQPQAPPKPAVEKQEAPRATPNVVSDEEGAHVALAALPAMTIFSDQLKVTSEGEALGAAAAAAAFHGPNLVALPIDRTDRAGSELLESSEQLDEDLTEKFESLPKGREVLGGGGGDRPKLGDTVAVTAGQFAGRTGRILADDKDLWPYTVEGLPGLWSEEQLQKVSGSQAASAAPAAPADASEAVLAASDALRSVDAGEAAASASLTEPDGFELAEATETKVRQATHPTTPHPLESIPLGSLPGAAYRMPGTAPTVAPQEATGGGQEQLIEDLRAAQQQQQQQQPELAEAAAADVEEAFADDGQWIGGSAESRRAFAEAEDAAAEDLIAAAEAYPQEASPLPEPQTHLAADPAASKELAETVLGVEEAKTKVMGLVRHKLNQNGYKVIADLGHNETMATFIRLVVEANGGSVLDEQALRAFASYHSGENGTQNFSRLLGELKTETWNSVVAVPAPTDRFAPFTATLDVDGFNFVAAQKDAAQLLAFVTRFVSANGGSFLDLDKLLGFCRAEVSSEELSFDSVLQQLRAATWIRGMEPREKEPPLILLEERSDNASAAPLIVHTLDLQVSEEALQAASDPASAAALLAMAPTAAPTAGLLEVSQIPATAEHALQAASEAMLASGAGRRAILAMAGAAAALRRGAASDEARAGLSKPADVQVSALAEGSGSVSELQKSQPAVTQASNASGDAKSSEAPPAEASNASGDAKSSEAPPAEMSDARPRKLEEVPAPPRRTLVKGEWHMVGGPFAGSRLLLGQQVTAKVARVLDVTGGRVNQAAYMEVARLNDTEAMGTFIRLAIRANGGIVTSTDGLSALAPEHSGEVAIQNYRRLQNELKAANWTTVGEPPRKGEDIALKATLDEDGYEDVQDEHDSSKMLRFMQRVMTAYGGTVEGKDNRVLNAFAAYHSGEKHSFTFDELIQQLRGAPWVHNLEISPQEMEERRLKRYRALEKMRESGEGDRLPRHQEPPKGQ